MDILRQSMYLEAWDNNGWIKTLGSSKKGLGVSAFKPLGSSVTVMTGRALSVCSTIHIVVVSMAAVRNLVAKIENNAFLQLRSSRSQMPPKSGALT